MWYTYAEKVYEITIIRLKLREKLRKAYADKDTDYLSQVAENILPDLKERYISLKNVHKKQWDSVYKPFGFEVISFRYGGLISRTDDYKEAIEKYLSGETEKIAELEETVLTQEDPIFGMVTSLLVTPSSSF